MKVNRQLAALEPLVLAPLEGLAGEDWHRAPEGRWSVAQIVSHLALGFDAVVQRLEERKHRTDLMRRATPKHHLLRHLILGVGRIPRGRRAVAATDPEDRPDPELVSAQLRMAIQRLTTLVETLPVEQQQRVFVRHPVVGDLNIPEWVRFFYVHNRHHAHQIAVRLRWLKRQKRKERRRRAGDGRTGRGRGTRRRQ